jgi:uncharacterized protein (DUF362 family)
LSGDERTGSLSRREFLAGAAAAAVCAGAYWLRDTVGPKGPGQQVSTDLPDFSVPATAGRMSIVTGADRAKTVCRAIEALGGIAAFVKPGDRVLLKVNAAFAIPAALSATTHPQLVAELAGLCRSAGATVLVSDNPINDPASCFALSGIESAARGAGAKVLLPSDDQFRPITVPGARLLRHWPVLLGALAAVNKVIGIAPLKHHQHAGASMTIKNWYGLLGGRRNTLHQDINTTIAELAMMVRPTLVILDGTTTMMRNGPTGGSLDDLAPTHTMIVGTDPVAVDAFGATLLGLRPADLPYLAMAETAGRGTTDYESLKPRRSEAS